MKAELRKEMRKRLRDAAPATVLAPAPATVPTSASAIAVAAAQTPAASPAPTLPEEAVFSPPEIKTIFAYLPHGNEIDVAPIIARALQLGKIVAVPKVSGDTMSFHRIDSAEGPFVTGAFGIREPLSTAIRVFPSSGGRIEFPVLILIPGLAFDRAGRRLGRGAGFYDRFLSAFLATFPDRRQEITLAGVCHSFQIVDEVPVDAHDIPVDCLLTEKGCILCMKVEKEKQNG